MRLKIMFDGDYELYSKLIIIFEGLKRGIKYWLSKKKLPYLTKKQRVIDELKSLPSLGNFIGGEDYRRNMLKFRNLIENETIN